MAQFLRPTLATKLLLGALPYGILTILIAFTALSSLQSLNEIYNRIIGRDVPLVHMADEMIDTLLTQEFYGRRFLILKSPEMERLLWKKSEEFRKLLRQMGGLPDAPHLPLDRLAKLHKEYDHLFKTELEEGVGFSSPDFQNYERKIRQKQEELIQLAKGISDDAVRDQSEKSLKTLNVGHSALWMTAGLGIGGLLLGIMISLTITRKISGSIDQLKLSTREISEGRFDHLPEVSDRDELGDLSHAFQKMAQRLKQLEQMHLDANPLTHLPGSAVIEHVLNERLERDIPLAFCQLDLSHFKAFNDRYGYARGNEVIRATARTIIEVVEAQGKDVAFVGHIGGDDFVLITSVEWSEKICPAVIDSFDRMIRNYYDPKDRDRGYIQGQTRQGQKVFVPIMTMAISVVTNQYCRLENHIQVGEIAAEMKNYAKSFPHSIVIVDRRKY